MKLNTTILPLEKSVENATSVFSIKTTAKAFKILSDGLYKDKILAFVRELSRNAYDSHIAAGRKNVPFEIHLPNSLEPFYHVKDFGTGLSHENVLHLYTTYFESTKTDSNDFVGALGLGSKSPFSYTSNFTVKSRFDGRERVYSCFLSETGIPSIVKMGESSYDGLPGLTVVIPVESQHFNNVFTAVTKDLFFWDGTKPNVVGHSGFVIKSPSISISGKNWYVMKQDVSNLYPKTPFAIQGNVGYPISSSLLTTENDVERSAIALMAKICPVISFDIGQLDVTASREELSYDKPTIKNLIQRIVITADEFLITFKTSIDKIVKESKTEFDFRHDMLELINAYMNSYGHDFITFAKRTIPSVTWNNEKYEFSDLQTKSLTLLFNNLIPFGMFRCEPRHTSQKMMLHKTVIGIVYAADKTRLPASKKQYPAYLEANSGYSGNASVNRFIWWDTRKNVLTRRMRDGHNEFENYITTNKDKLKDRAIITGFNLSDVFTGINKTILFNDARVHGTDIILQYIKENALKSVFVIDYHKRTTGTKEIKDFLTQLKPNISGLTFLNVSQLKLITPLVKVKKTGVIARDINSVTAFNYTAPGTGAATLNRTMGFSLKSFDYSIHSKTDGVLSTPYAKASFNEEIDFSTGDFYYFHELRNHMYLDSANSIRIDPVKYLNVLNEFKVLDSAIKIVGLRPTQLNKISKHKKHGKLISMKSVDDEFRKLILADSDVKNGYLISLLNSPRNNIFTPLSKDTTLAAYTAQYGNLTSGNTGIKLFDKLRNALIFAQNRVDVNVRKKIALLEMVLYFNGSTLRDSSYKTALGTIFSGLPNIASEASKLEDIIERDINSLETDYPLLKFITDNNYGNSATKMIDAVIDYVQHK